MKNLKPKLNKILKKNLRDFNEELERLLVKLDKIYKQHNKEISHTIGCCLDDYNTHYLSKLNYDYEENFRKEVFENIKMKSLIILKYNPNNSIIITQKNNKGDNVIGNINTKK
ncbi:MAG: hypothetical protein KGV59_06145 [Tenacibaculum sp.]|nr:hypothetical protein [Tenacibaculum sp.]